MPHTELKTESFDLFQGPDAPQEEDLYKCVHCGFCLQVCPTYVETGLETESPRGRIALMKAVNEGRIGITENVSRHWELCIQCRACESACPSGVPYGKLIESSMTQVSRKKHLSVFSGFIRNMLLKYILPNQNILKVLANLLTLYQKSGFKKLIQTTRLLNLISPNLSDLHELSPEISSNKFDAVGQIISAEGSVRARVALLSGCVMPLINGPEMDAVTRVLSRNGCEVVVPEGQTCCGAINSHVGDLDTARDMAKQNIEIFMDHKTDAIISASAGCGVRMKEYPHLFEGDSKFHNRAKSFANTVKDIHEFLVDLPFVHPKGKLNYKVTYQGPCHLSHAQGIIEAPRALLKSIPGIDLVDMEKSYLCCGAGGTYNLTEREFSMKVLDSKMDCIIGTSADVIATANPGCHMQLKFGVDRTKSAMEVMYVTDLMDLSYQLG